MIFYFFFFLTFLKFAQYILKMHIDNDINDKFNFLPSQLNRIKNLSLLKIIKNLLITDNMKLLLNKNKSNEHDKHLITGISIRQQTHGIIFFMLICIISILYNPLLPNFTIVYNSMPQILHYKENTCDKFMIETDDNKCIKLSKKKLAFLTKYLVSNEETPEILRANNITVIPFFWHIPKAAGVTFRKEIRLIWNITPISTENVRDKLIRLVKKGDIPEFIVSTMFYSLEPLLKAIQNKLSYPVKFKMFDIMRHPYERQQSLYYYLKDAEWEDTYHHDLHNKTFLQYLKSEYAEKDWATNFLSNATYNRDITLRKVDNDLAIAKYVLSNYAHNILIEDFIIPSPYIVKDVLDLDEFEEPPDICSIGFVGKNALNVNKNKKEDYLNERYVLKQCEKNVGKDKQLYQYIKSKILIEQFLAIEKEIEQVKKYIIS